MTAFRSRVLSGLAWTGGAKLLGQLLTWGITILVIRKLEPADYGLLSMAAIVGSFLTLLAEAGLGTALVQLRDPSEVILRRVFGAIVVVDLSLFLFQMAAAPAIAGFFDEPRLTPMIRVLAIQFLLMIFISMPVSLLSRELDFKRQSIVDLLSGLVASVSTLAMVLADWGVWSLVLGNVFSTVFRAVAINVVAPFPKWPEFSLENLRELVLFGGQVTGSRILWFAYSQADVLIAGKVLGKELLGFYSVSMHLASLPVQKISAVLNQVAFPAFAHAQHDTAAVAYYLMKAFRILSFFSFPILWGMSSVAPELVVVVLGDKWQQAIVPLQLLPLVMPLTILSPFLNSAFQGIGRGGIVFSNVLTACLVMPVLLFAGAHAGLIGLALAWVAGFPVVLLINLKRMLPEVGLRLRDCVRAVSPSLLSAAAMFGVVSISRSLVSGLVAPSGVMALLVAMGCISYASFSWVMNRAGIAEIVELLQRKPAVAL
jgi:teichuronic acid exporter